METAQISSFIPSHKEGKELDLDYSVSKETRAEADILYRSASKRLLSPFLWHNIAGSGTAEFNIHAVHKTVAPVNRQVEVNDHLYIDIPVSGMLKPEAHDWVIVEDIRQNIVKEADESIGLKLRACPDPTDTDNKASHFFTTSATSTLIIQRAGNTVTASYHGRNEKPNIETGDTATNIRNGMVAFGAIIGLSKVQWTALIKGFLSD